MKPAAPALPGASATPGVKVPRPGAPCRSEQAPDLSLTPFSVSHSCTHCLEGIPRMGLGNGDMTYAVWNYVRGDEHRATSPCFPSGPGRGWIRAPGHVPPVAMRPGEDGGGVRALGHVPLMTSVPEVWGGGVIEFGKRAPGPVPQDHRGIPSDPSPTRARRHDAVRRGIPSGRGGAGRGGEGAAAVEPGAGEWSVGGNPAGVTASPWRDPGSGATGRPDGPARRAGWRMPTSTKENLLPR
jgi:hypothetical protein